MPPKASTSAAPNAAPKKAAAPKKPANGAASTSKPAGSKLTPKEKQIHEFAMRSENHVITQEMLSAEFDWKAADFIQDIQTLLKKRLLQLHKSDSGAVFWVGVAAASAQQAANNTDEGNLLLNLIEQSGNMGIWSRTLKAKSGLHQTVIDKALKHLEGQRAIKSVKSIKHPTRKIYLLFGVAPSTELTGGPWYSGSDLDVEFVTNLLKLANRLVQQASCPNGQTDQLYPIGHTPFLPSSYDILQGIKQSNATSVPLNEEHIEALLEVLRMDGEVERVQVMREGGDYDSQGSGSEEEEEEEEEAPPARPNKRKATGSAGGKRKKRVKTEDGAEEEEEAEEDGSGEDQDQEEEDAEDDKEQANGSSGRRKRVGPPGRDKFYYVYRSIPQPANLNIYIGLIDAPCGVCPVAASCDNRGRPSMDDEPLSQVGTVGYIAGASKLSKEQKEKQLVAFKPPGSMGDTASAGPWQGGASRGVQRPGAINPATCRYYREWLEG